MSKVNNLQVNKVWSQTGEVIPERILLEEQSQPLPFPLSWRILKNIGCARKLQRALWHAHAFQKAPSRCYYHRCCEKKASCANPAYGTISTIPVWEFRNANSITKFIGVFIAVDLRSFSIVDKQAGFLNFPRNYEPYRPIPYRYFKTEVRTEPWLLCTVTLLIYIYIKPQPC